MQSGSCNRCAPDRQVRVTLDEHEGNDENLTSAASDAVAPAPEPLTASFSGMPSEHAGAGTTFTFRRVLLAALQDAFAAVQLHFATGQADDRLGIAERVTWDHRPGDFMSPPCKVPAGP